MLDEYILTDEKAIKIVSDPLRQKVLRALIDHGALTSSGVSRILGLAASKVHYHLGKLESVGLIELDHEEIINGIQARFMRPVARSFKMNSDTIRRNPSTQSAVLQVVRNELDQMYDLLERELARPDASDAAVLLSRLQLTPQQAQDLNSDLQALLSRWEDLARPQNASGNTGSEAEPIRAWKLLLTAVPDPADAT